MRASSPPPLLDDPDQHLRHTLLGLQGRIGRRTWWWYGVLLPLGIAAFLHVLLGIARVPQTVAEMGINALLLWPFIAVSVKRWHDLGRSGWWLLVVLIPGLGLIWLLIANGLVRGDAGANRFGAAPGSVGAGAFGAARPGGGAVAA
jgi:uncharacterized membrane protein YhaH (DUF805 family)